MDPIIQGLKEVVSLLLNMDKEVLEITLLSLKVSVSATLVSLIFGLFIAFGLTLYDFPTKRILITLINTGMGIPPVVVGLVVSMLLWRSGPLGSLNLLYTPYAMIIAQSLIATPCVSGITLAALQGLPKNLLNQILGLGATRLQLLFFLLREARTSILASAMAGFGAVISEVGASMMVGGNIKGSTRVLTTATVLETSKGNFEMAMALSIILFSLTFSISLCLTHIQQKGVRGKW